LLVSRRAIVDIVRSAALGSYGVAGFSAPRLARALGMLGLGSPGIRVHVRDTKLTIELDLEVGHGLPVAEVARQVDSAVRYAIRRALDHDVGSLLIHVDRLRFETGQGVPTSPMGEPGSRPVDGSGRP